MVEQHGVEDQLAVAVVQDRHHERVFAVAIDALADDVGALIPEKQARQHLDLVIRFQRLGAENVLQARFDLGDVAVEVGEWAGQLEVGHDTPEGDVQAILGRVIHAVGGGRFLGLDIFGRHHRPHKDEIVMEIGAVQDVAAHGIEEGFS